MSLGHTLRILRKQKGYTLAELAKKTGSYVGNLSRIERGLCSPSLDLLYRISAALNFSLAEIFSTSEPGDKISDPNQVALNTIFISLLERDRELLLAFAKLLQERHSLAAENVVVDKGQVPSEPEPTREKRSDRALNKTT